MPHADVVGSGSTTAEYTCKAGYEFSNGQGSVTAKCKNYAWSIPDAYCKPASCPPLVVEHGVVDTGGVLRYGVEAGSSF